MRTLFRKIYLYSIVILLGVNSNVMATNIFSHTVLNLPSELITEKPWVRVITTQEDWKIFFNELTVNSQLTLTDEQVLPEIDFTTFQVVAGGLGFRSHDGDRLLIESVFTLENQVEINALIIKAGESCVTPDVISYPTVAILIRKSEKQIHIGATELVGECFDE